MSNFTKKVAIVTASAAIAATAVLTAGAPAQAASAKGYGWQPAPSCLTRNTSTVAHKAYLYNGCGAYGSGSDLVQFKFSCVANHPVETSIARGRSYIYSPGSGTVQIPSNCGITAWMWLQIK